MSGDESKILKAKLPYDPVCKAKPSDSIVKHILEKIDALVQSGQGDRPWLTDICVLDQPQVQRLSEVRPLAFQAASAFKKLGLKAGDVVQFYLPNSIDYYGPVFGAWLNGAIVSLTCSTLKAPTIRSQIEDTQPKYLFCYQSNLAAVEQASTGQTLIVLNTNGADCGHLSFEKFMAMGDDVEVQLPTPDVDEVTMILWTSGTTGLPKGIKHSHRNLINLVVPIVSSTSYLYSTTVFYHMSGYNLVVSGGVFGNADIVFHGNNYPFESRDIMVAAHKYKPSLMFTWTHHIVQLGLAEPQKDLDLSSVLIIGPLGSSVDTSLLNDLRTKFPNLQGVMNIYGMTEIGSIATSLCSTNLGPIFNGREVKIVDPDTQELQGPHGIGEIWAKTPMATVGFVNRPGLTEESFAPGGFYKTGDLGYYDEKGILYFHDRLKDLIKYKNSQIYPSEIEAVLMEHPDIDEVAVYGTPEPAVQELVSVCVVKSPSSKLTEAEVKELVAKADLDDSLLIRGPVKFVSHIPKNAHGKILRKSLREFHANECN